MNKTSLTYFLLAALCLVLMLVSCKGKKKRIESFIGYSKDSISYGYITAENGLTENVKLDGMGLVNITIDTTLVSKLTDVKNATTSRMTITPIKHDTIYIYRDTCTFADLLKEIGWDEMPPAIIWDDTLYVQQGGMWVVDTVLSVDTSQLWIRK